jgi:hypothetical protein
LTKKLIFTIIFTGIIFFISSCGKGNGGSNPPPADPCSGLSSKFAADVKPIINTSCASSVNCHGAGSNNAGGPLTDYNLIFAKRLSIKFQIENGLMPKGSSLTADQKNKIICWINSGAPNN